MCETNRNIMKKILILIAALSIAGGSFAQFTFGPKVGYTTTTLSIDRSDISNSLNSGFLFGAFIRAGSKVYLQPEINLYTSGTSFSSENTSLMPFDQRVTLTNIQVPLFIGFNLIDLKLVKLRATGGPTANYVVKKDISISLNNPIKEKDIRDIHWGVQFGLGVDALMFTLDVQYILGISKLIDTIHIPVGSTEQPIVFDSRNKGFVVSLGWKIL